MTGEQRNRVTADELAALAGTDGGRVKELAEAGLVSPDAEGRYTLGDVHRVRLIDAFIVAGVPVNALVEAKERDVISFAYYERLHPAPGPVSMRTYAEFRASLGERAPLLSQLITALGLAEPAPEARLPEEDEAILVELADIVAATGVPDLGLRVARLFGDGSRRAMEAVLTVYGEAVERLVGEIAGLPSLAINEEFLRPWNRFAQIAPDLGRWLTARHLSTAIDSFSVTTSEEFLATAGFVAPRGAEPPAIAFVDLAEFTRYAVERGDEPAARVALEFGQLADRVARRTGGRMVKLLGDGALLQFDSLADAIDAALDLLDELPQAGLPPGHAGIDAGPIIVRDGDVFGRTVNRASRIADVADPDTLLLAATLSPGLRAGAFAVTPAGQARLSGIPEPVELVRITRQAR